MSYPIRLAEARDIPAIADIYNQAIELRNATAHTSPITVQERAAWLADHAPDAYPVWVATSDERVVGYCSLSAYRPGRMALRRTAEISYYVLEEMRGRGVATALISHAIEQCPHLGFKAVFAILLDINPDSVRLLEKFQFEQWGHLPGIAEIDGRELGQLYYGRRVVP